MSQPTRSHLFVLLLLVCAAWAPGAGASVASDERVRAHLVSEVSEVEAGEPFWVGLHLRMKDGWHTYWQNPGDSGRATQIEWELPQGFEAGPIHWPAPERLMAGPVVNFGYQGEVVLLVQITPPDSLEAGASLPIRARANWLVCEGECVPGEAELELGLRASAGESVFDQRSGEIVADARAALPGPSPWKTSFDVEDDRLRLRFGDASLAAARLDSVTFFPASDTVIEHGADQRLRRDDLGLRLSLEASPLSSGTPKALDGVLLVREAVGDGILTHAYEIHALQSNGRLLAGAGAGEKSDTAGALGVDAKGGELLRAGVVAAATPGDGPGLLQVLLLALLGGIILNLMPCVFPVLSLKVLGVAQQAGEDARRVRHHGVAYTAGILVSFAILAGALLALRAGGAQIGWGFQLQSPGFVALLAFILFALALSLSGVIQIGGSIMGVGSSLASRPGLSGSFFTGVLATVVATPCTAPFMGAAVGFALTQSAIVALSVFLALGFGLALPFLLISFVPALHRLLPRPGAWMETLQKALAFPLYATVAWLVWVVQLQSGSTGLAAVLAGLVLVGLGAWAYGSTRTSRPLGRRVGLGVGAISTVAVLMLASVPVASVGGAGSSPSLPSTTAAGGAKVQPESFSQARLDEVLGSGKPVFINFTAAWCVTCLMNERTTISRPAVQDAIASKEIVYLKGDWTNEDPEITRVLERYGRSGVPLYLFYDGRSKEPVILPQILTEATMLEKFGAL